MNFSHRVASVARGLFIAAACAASFGILSSQSRAALVIASDTAADAVYNDGWQAGDNGGSGWGGGWSFRNQANAVLTAPNGNRGWFIGNSLGNNPASTDSNGDGDVNTPGDMSGRAWGAYSNSNDAVYAIRPLASPLSVGQTVSWEMDNGNVNPFTEVGVRLISNIVDPNNSRVFEAGFFGGQSNYRVTDSLGDRPTTLGFSREGIKVDYTLTGPSAYSVTLTRLSNGASETITGTNINANAINGIVFRNSFAGSGGAADAFFNSITVTAVPEPATSLAGSTILAGLALLVRRRS